LQVVLAQINLNILLTHYLQDKQIESNQNEKKSHNFGKKSNIPKMQKFLLRLQATNNLSFPTKLQLT
jgi:hypothetical protein